jgi:hypothetical protein
MRLQWRDLDRLTKGRRIALQLPSGIKLQGDVVSINTDELVLDVCKTSNKQAYPKGRAIVPRPEVTRLNIIRTRHTWRVVGTAIGAGIGTAVAVPVAIYGGNEGVIEPGMVVLAAAVPTAVGYLLGWAGDRNVMHIVVEPDR